MAKSRVKARAEKDSAIDDLATTDEPISGSRFERFGDSA